MIAQTAQFLWIGPRLSRMELLCLRSFVDHGYNVHLYTYAPIENVPPGVTLMDGRDILPETSIFKNGPGFGEGSYAGFSDLFRYHLIYKRGGWWFDMDFVSIRPFPEPPDLWFASSFENEWGVCANGCAIFAPPAHPALKILCTEAERILGEGPLRFGAIGPELVQHLVTNHNLQHHVSPWPEFSPYPWRQMFRLAMRGRSDWLKDKLRLLRYLVRQFTNPHFNAGYLRKNTRALHLHNEIWRSSNINKNDRFYHRSLYEKLQKKHGVV